METALRGLIEQEIDQLLAPEALDGLVLMFQQVYEKSNEDTLFGFIIGSMLGRFLTIVAVAHNRLANDSEIKEFLTLTEKRTMEIRGKIKLAMNK
jgi:hypothetical protein